MLLTRRWLGTEVEAAPAPEASASSSSTASALATPKDVRPLASVKAPGRIRKQGRAGVRAAAKAVAGSSTTILEEAAEEAAEPPAKSKRRRKAAAESAAGGDGACAAEPTPQAEAPGLITKKPTGVKAASAAARHESRRARRRRHRKNLKTKEPEVASSYLQAWEQREQAKPAEGGWKFNKATQAWLLRHAYEPAKVAKSTFDLLLRYLEGLQGAARERTCAEAGAIVELKGARLTTEPDEEKEVEDKVEEEDEEGQKGTKARKRSRKPQDAEGGDAEDAAAQAEEVAKEEERLRKTRLRRAKRVLAVLRVSMGAGEDEAV